MALINCPDCGNQTSDKALACNKCGYPIASETNANIKTSNTTSNVVASVDEYYKIEFQKIEENKNNIGTKYYGKWNWFAFLFTWIWYFVKGCYFNGITILLSNIAMVVFFQRLWNNFKDSQFAPFCWFSQMQYTFFAWGIIGLYCGINGTWEYYNFKELNKKWVTPPFNNFLKLIIGIVVLAILFYLYERIFDQPLISHGRGVD